MSFPAGVRSPPPQAGGPPRGGMAARGAPGRGGMPGRGGAPSGGPPQQQPPPPQAQQARPMPQMNDYARGHAVQPSMANASSLFGEGEGASGDPFASTGGARQSVQRPQQPQQPQARPQQQAQQHQRQQSQGQQAQQSQYTQPPRPGQSQIQQRPLQQQQQPQPQPQPQPQSAHARQQSYSAQRPAQQAWPPQQQQITSPPQQGAPQFPRQTNEAQRPRPPQQQASTQPPQSQSQQQGRPAQAPPGREPTQGQSSQQGQQPSQQLSSQPSNPRPRQPSQPPKTHQKSQPQGAGNVRSPPTSQQQQHLQQAPHLQQRQQGQSSQRQESRRPEAAPQPQQSAQTSAPRQQGSRQQAARGEQDNLRSPQKQQGVQPSQQNQSLHQLQQQPQPNFQQAGQPSRGAQATQSQPSAPRPQQSMAGPRDSAPTMSHSGYNPSSTQRQAPFGNGQPNAQAQRSQQPAAAPRKASLASSANLFGDNADSGTGNDDDWLKGMSQEDNYVGGNEAQGQNGSYFGTRHDQSGGMAANPDPANDAQELFGDQQYGSEAQNGYDYNYQDQTEQADPYAYDDQQYDYGDLQFDAQQGQADYSQQGQYYDYSQYAYEGNAQYDYNAGAYQEEYDPYAEEGQQDQYGDYGSGQQAQEDQSQLPDDQAAQNGYYNYSEQYGEYGQEQGVQDSQGTDQYGYDYSQYGQHDQYGEERRASNAQLFGSSDAQGTDQMFQSDVGEQDFFAEEAGAQTQAEADSGNLFSPPSQSISATASDQVRPPQEAQKGINPRAAAQRGPPPRDAQRPMAGPPRAGPKSTASSIKSPPSQPEPNPFSFFGQPQQESYSDDAALRGVTSPSSTHASVSAQSATSSGARRSTTASQASRSNYGPGRVSVSSQQSNQQAVGDGTMIERDIDTPGPHRGDKSVNDLSFDRMSLGRDEDVRSQPSSQSRRARPRAHADADRAERASAFSPPGRAHPQQTPTFSEQGYGAFPEETQGAHDFDSMLPPEGEAQEAQPFEAQPDEGTVFNGDDQAQYGYGEQDQYGPEQGGYGGYDSQTNYDAYANQGDNYVPYDADGTAEPDTYAPDSYGPPPDSYGAPEDQQYGYEDANYPPHPSGEQQPEQQAYPGYDAYGPDYGYGPADTQYGDYNGQADQTDMYGQGYGGDYSEQPSYEQYAAPTDAATGRGEDPLSRQRSNIPIIAFSAVGRLVTHFPRDNDDGQSSFAPRSSSTKLSIRKLTSAVESASYASNLNIATFPGPLFESIASNSALARATGGVAGQSKAKKTAVLQHLNEAVSSLSSGLSYLTGPRASEGRTVKDRIVLLRVLASIVEHDGQTIGNTAFDKAVVDVLTSMAEGEAEPHQNGSAMQPQQTNRAPADEYFYKQLQTLLLRGDRKEAVAFARENQCWTHAVIIASGMDKEAWRNIVQDFMDAEFGDADQHSLKVAYGLFSGQEPRCFYDVFRPKELLGDGQSDQSPPTDGQWYRSVAMILANRSAGDSAGLTAIGDGLAVSGFIEAAHTCYLLSPQTSALDSFDAPGARYTLIGAHSPQASTAFARDLDSIMLTEIYEFALGLRPQAKGADSYQGLPHLHPYRALHASCLAELGETKKALKYCDAIASVLKTSKMNRHVHPVLLQGLQELQDRLSGDAKAAAGPGSAAGWLKRKPTVDGVWGALEGRFTKFIAGEDDSSTDKTPTRPAAAVGPFSHYSAITPDANAGGISRVGSVADFGNAHSNVQQQQARSASSVAHSRPDSRASTSKGNNARNGVSPLVMQQPSGPPPGARQEAAEQQVYSDWPQPSAPPKAPRSGTTGTGDTTDTELSNAGPYTATSTEAAPWATPTADNDQDVDDEEPQSAAGEQPYYGYESHGAGEPSFVASVDQEEATGEEPSEEGDGVLTPMDTLGGAPVPTFNTDPYAPSRTQRSDEADEAEVEDDLGFGNKKAKREPSVEGDDDAFESPDDEDEGGQARSQGAEARKSPQPDSGDKSKAAQKPAELKPQSSWLGRLLGGGSKRDASSEGEQKAAKAHLGEETSFYYDKDLKRWVNKKAGDTPQAATPPPPPPRSASGTPSLGGSTPPPPKATPSGDDVRGGASPAAPSAPVSAAQSPSLDLSEGESGGESFDSAGPAPPPSSTVRQRSKLGDLSQPPALQPASPRPPGAPTDGAGSAGPSPRVGSAAGGPPSTGWAKGGIKKKPIGKRYVRVD